MKKYTVTATISTKGRYFTTLSHTIGAIAQQTVLPDQLVIFDDNEDNVRADLRTVSPYNYLFQVLDSKGIKWRVVFGQKIGQLANHQMALDCAETEMIWRQDDDNAAEPNCLEGLLKQMDDPSVGAVGGMVIEPQKERPRPSFVTGKIEDIYNPFNLAWYRWGGKVEEVDHLYSTFLYRVEAGRKAGGYNKQLSPVCHREETMFSHEIKRAGYKLLVTPDALTWHFHEPTGGIRSYKDPSLWDRDEQVFANKMKEWGVVPREYKFVVLNNGIGDHYMAKPILKELISKNVGKRIVVAACYPECFEDINDITLVSIADAKAAFDNDLDRWDIYKWCTDRQWKNSLVEAFRNLYL